MSKGAVFYYRVMEDFATIACFLDYFPENSPSLNSSETTCKEQDVNFRCDYSPALIRPITLISEPSSFEKEKNKNSCCIKLTLQVTLLERSSKIVQDKFAFLRRTSFRGGRKYNANDP